MICPAPSDAAGGLAFQLLQRFFDGLSVSFRQPCIAAQLGHNGNGLWSRDGEVVQISASALCAAIGGCAVGAVALPEELAAIGIEALPDGLELRRLNFAGEAEQFRSPALPLANDALAFGVVVAMLQMAGGVASSVRHGANGQHK